MKIWEGMWALLESPLAWGPLLIFGMIGLAIFLNTIWPKNKK